MPRRRNAREAAIQVLYQDDLNPGGNPAVGDQWIQRRLVDEDAVEFARGLVAGVRKNRRELDEAIAASAENWTLERMAVTDRCVLRLGAYEILLSETPAAVAIDEAIELAKRFGAAQSPQFVNGVLDRLIRQREASG
ncbi:MAG: transcription antitermination factor NusB [Pirellulales bacterium]|nr:transcription antitermination factor NusB [Pirellulales bacterium]